MDGDLEQLTIAQAAARLNKSSEAVRKLADRDRLKTTRVDGRRYILLPRPPAPKTIEEEIAAPALSTPEEVVPDISDLSADQVSDLDDVVDPRDELVAQLRSENAYLRETLHREQTISARFATSLEETRQLLIPAATSVPAVSDQVAASPARPRPWWRFW